MALALALMPPVRPVRTAQERRADDARLDALVEGQMGILEHLATLTERVAQLTAQIVSYAALAARIDREHQNAALSPAGQQLLERIVKSEKDNERQDERLGSLETFRTQMRTLAAIATSSAVISVLLYILEASHGRIP